ncbi:MAG TPA: SDR family NAD(P)-dependent oxidoreductase [Acidimicrobiales bacterium]|nr:SDR family NAD(P)-dependent oxidoreductase [Acidimicrobiales bacterium]
MAPQAEAPLKGKIVVVTGASRGIGKGIALELGYAGATVYLTGRTTDASPGAVGSLAETAAQIDAGGGVAIPVRCDHSIDAEVRALLDRVRDEQHGLDLLVNNVFDSAGFRHTIGVPFWELDDTVWHDVFDLGTRSAYIACVHATPLMLESGGGLIVNISARGAERYRHNVVYGVGKGAMDRMTRDMAEELRGHPVSIVSLWPGTIRTEHLESIMAAGDRWAIESFGDIDALETPRYVGRAVVALAADPNVAMRTGGRYWAAELGRDYAFTDERGRPHDLPE